MNEIWQAVKPEERRNGSFIDPGSIELLLSEENMKSQNSVIDGTSLTLGTLGLFVTRCSHFMYTSAESEPSTEDQTDSPRSESVCPAVGCEKSYTNISDFKVSISKQPLL